MDQMHQKATVLRRKLTFTWLFCKRYTATNKLFFWFKMRHKCWLPRTEESAALQSSWIALQALGSLAAHNKTSS